MTKEIQNNKKLLHTILHCPTLWNYNIKHTNDYFMHISFILQNYEVKSISRASLLHTFYSLMWVVCDSQWHSPIIYKTKNSWVIFYRLVWLDWAHPHRPVVSLLAVLHISVQSAVVGIFGGELVERGDLLPVSVGWCDDIFRWCLFKEGL